MFRRLIALLIVSVSLLAAAVPTMACGAMVGNGDCCPTRVPPCTGGERETAATPAAAACCVVTSLPKLALVLESGRRDAVRAQQSGTPDPLASASLAAVVQRSVDERPVLIDADHARRNDASLTYLLTARLRL